MGRYTDVDDAVIALAATQRGVITRAQLAALQLSPKAVRARVSSRRLLPKFGARVFYVPGAPPCRERDLLAAVLATGGAAYGSHSSAAVSYDFTVPLQAHPEVTVILERCPRIDGIRLHRSGRLVERDVTEVAGVPLTTPERTIVDLSGRLDQRQLVAIAHDAIRRRLTNIPRLNACTERLKRAPGRSQKTMRSVVARLLTDGVERESVLEDFVYEAIGRFGLPRPTCQYEIVVGGRRYRIDMCYPSRMIALEALGFDPHRSRLPFDNDCIRGNDLVLAGFKVLEFTSAFTDWQIATTVASALQLPLPARPERPLTFAAWCRATEFEAIKP
jgi:hypothetical protein